MKRIALTDGSGWFDLEKATAFKEGSWWDGRNHISKATGGQWNHEILYRTKNGKWVLNAYSQSEGSRETYETITDSQAAAWFIKNEYENDKIPLDLFDVVKAYLEQSEV